MVDTCAATPSLACNMSRVTTPGELAVDAACCFRGCLSLFPSPPPPPPFVEVGRWH